MASEDLLKKAVAAFNALSPEQQAEMLEEQRQSWVRGNVGLSRDERGMTIPVAPVSPDATGKCGELETKGHMFPDGKFNPLGRSFTGPAEELVTRSQAVELLAAEIRRERDLSEKQLSEVVDRMSDDYLTLKADNAALTARVTELEDKRIEDRFTVVDEMEKREALEAKLTAAEKVRVAAEHVVWFDWSDNDDDAVKAVSDLRTALEGKPS